MRSQTEPSPFLVMRSRHLQFSLDITLVEETGYATFDS
ncbi:unnamed protein product [Arabidopsis halleri]